ncbi:MAG: hypothetical protein JWQ25_2502 [Daejeonella sp.]|nr:hypothetical protein [Daejeonella sp.]
MSKIVYVCFRNADLGISLKKDIEKITERITPDNFTPTPPKIVELDGIIYGIVNPVDLIEEKNGSVLLGGRFDDDDNWWQPTDVFPDGSYALFRSNAQRVQLVSDVVGSRTIWYYKNDDLFVASTSQRAIISIIGSFKFNGAVLPWLLSSGSTGPFNSWDIRLKMVPPDSSITLDRESWTLTETVEELNFTAELTGDESHEKKFYESLIESFRSLKLDYTKWGLLLSGGYDSRSILIFLKLISNKLDNLRTITWGLGKVENQPGNDAFVAKKLAAHFKVPHKYYTTDLSSEPIGDIFERFLVCGEGRIDHLGGYLDGFKIWKSLYEDNVKGIIRGDVGFNEKVAASSDTAFKLLGMALCSDYSNLKNYQSFGMVKQEFPASFLQKEGESLANFRDRFYVQCRIPTVLAALNDLKLPYVEIINPLLSRRIMKSMYQLPEQFRNKKILFKTIVNTLSPNIEFATDGANAEGRNILKGDHVVKFLKKVLSSDNAKSIFSESFLNYILLNIKTNDKIVVNKRQRYKSLVYNLMPFWILRNSKKMGLPKSAVDCNLLAFRVYMACRMNEMLISDSKISNFNFQFESSL